MTDDRAAACDDLRFIGRRTAQRATVPAALVARAGFTSARVLHARMVADGEQVGLSTVYRTLAALAEAGRADLVRDPAGGRLFRHRPSAEHGHYLLCRRCGLGTPVDSAVTESWAARIARSSGYADVQHTAELIGTCPACLAEADTEAAPEAAHVPPAAGPGA
ncbi:Fur family transcriptional regulator [Streptomyces sp. NPDC087658]|uniref:Fur family transcriptional regulator n=1 Tax=Streptomyces sp. NPDC087658 TaxID=3365800 RepID=UPI003808EB26